MSEANISLARTSRGLRHLTYSILMAALMSFIVTGISSLANFGFDNFSVRPWLKAWSLALPIACLVLFLVGPTMHRANDILHDWLDACRHR